MRVITVARKPLAGTVAQTALRFGTGGINIDTCRIGVETVSTHSRGATTAYPKMTAMKTVEESGRITRQDFVEANPHAGRWPANLILQHRERCVCVGTSEITGIRKDTRPEGDGGREDKTQWRIRPTEQTRRGYADENGNETVPVWECESDCPVRDLDQQSGNKTGASAPVKGTEGSEPTDRVYGKYERVPGAFHGDTGGASRFFKQVRE